MDDKILVCGIDSILWKALHLNIQRQEIFIIIFKMVDHLKFHCLSSSIKEDIKFKNSVSKLTIFCLRKGRVVK